MKVCGIYSKPNYKKVYRKTYPKRKRGKRMGACDLRRLIRKQDRWYRRKKKSGNQRDAKKYKTLKQETQR